MKEFTLIYRSNNDGGLRPKKVWATDKINARKILLSEDFVFSVVNCFSKKELV